MSKDRQKIGVDTTERGDADTIQDIESNFDALFQMRLV